MVNPNIFRFILLRQERKHILQVLYTSIKLAIAPESNPFGPVEVESASKIIASYLITEEDD